MAKFMRTQNIRGTFKNICVIEGDFVDEDTNEVIDLPTLLSNVYGSRPFDIVTTLKTDEKIK